MNGRINFIDCSLRDGHQSLLATRMSTAQALRVLPMLVESGYSILELWGGATIDSAIRFTNDDPFERLVAFRAVCDRGPGHVQIRSLCRGQNLFGYTPYPDSVVLAFVKQAARLGNDRIRIFDALNDNRNINTALMAAKTFNAHAEVALSYTTSPVHDLEHFVRFAATAVDDGADSLCIKDMAGLLHPADLFELVEALRKRLGDIEISLHSHCTNGLATTTYVAAMLAGVDHLDTCYGPMAGSTAQPSVELMSYFARELGLETNVRFDRLAEIDDELRKIRVELKEFDKDPDKFGDPWPIEPTAEVREKVRRALALIRTRERAKLEEAIAIIEDEILVPQGYPAVDRTQLDAQVPGGMVSNLYNQLKAVGALENMQKILDEIPRVRADAGYPPLVTPTSQIVGTQAAFNVNSGARYSIISDPFRDLVLGKYGRTPGTPDPEVVKLCAPDGRMFSERPAEYAAKVDMAAVVKDAGDLLRTREDMLLYVLFPVPAKAFLEKKYAAKTPVAVA
jgi:pyruvate/oxaloacetate carboxyltransferase